MAGRDASRTASLLAVAVLALWACGTLAPLARASSAVPGPASAPETARPTTPAAPPAPVAAEPTDSLTACVGRLADPDSRVRLAAVRSLAALGPEAAPAAPALAQLLIDVDAEVRRTALRTLGALGPAAAIVAHEVSIGLAHEDPFTRIAAAEALPRLGRPEISAPALNGGLNDPSPGVRAACARSLGKLGPAGRVGVARLVRLSKDSTEVVRRAAVGALARIAPPTGRARFVAEGLASPDSLVRRRTPAALLEMGEEAVEAVPALLAALAHPDPQTRDAAAEALARIEPIAPRVRATLVAFVCDTVPTGRARVRVAQWLAGAQVSLAEAAPRMIEQLQSPDAPKRRVAADILGEIRPPSEAAMQALVAALRDPDPDVAAEAAKSLGEYGPAARGALPALREAVRRSPPWARALIEGAMFLIEKE